MDITLAQLAPAFNAAPAASLPLGPAAADPQATARFASIMNPPLAPVDAVPASSADAAPPPGGSLGDAILGGLKSASADFQDKWASVQSVLDNGNLTSVSDMLKLQLGLVQMSVQYEVLGKAVSRSTQNIDQLVKMQ